MRIDYGWAAALTAVAVGTLCVGCGDSQTANGAPANDSSTQTRSAETNGWVCVGSGKPLDSTFDEATVCLRDLTDGVAGLTVLYQDGKPVVWTIRAAGVFYPQQPDAAEVNEALADVAPILGTPGLPDADEPVPPGGFDGATQVKEPERARVCLLDVRGGCSRLDAADKRVR